MPRPMEAPIHIEPHDPRWAASFAAERDVIGRTIGPWLAGPIEHVGSTAVPGLAAKPVVDIMAAVRSLEASLPAVERLAGIGYCYAPYRPEAMHWLCKPGPEIRTHHLHVVPFGSELWKDRLAFRDRLRSDAALAAEYATLKYRLAALYRDDRERYTEAKRPFIERVLRGTATGAVTLVEHLDDWTRMFESESASVRGVFAPEPVRIEHIGSTAVRGMAAKPIVDILLGASSLRAIEERVGALIERGYRYVPEYEVDLPQRRYFEKPGFHLHAVETEGDFWRDHVAFRDVLRIDRCTFDAYLALKRELAASAMDRAAYTDAKAPFIQAVLASRRGRAMIS